MSRGSKFEVSVHETRREHALSVASLCQDADQEPLDKTDYLMDLIENDVAAIKVYINGVRLELNLEVK